MTTNQKDKDIFLKEVSRAFTLPQSTHEMILFLQAILTPDELEQTALRWQIIKRLLNSDSQRDVAEQLNISLATITRGSREIKHGSGIFQKIFERFTGKKL